MKNPLDRRVSTNTSSLSIREAAALVWLRAKRGGSSSARVGQALLDSAWLEHTLTSQELAEFRAKAGEVDYTQPRYQVDIPSGGGV
jgi:hypothetical protein